MQHLMIWKDERTKRYEKNENPEKPKPKIMQLPPLFSQALKNPNVQLSSAFSAAVSAVVKIGMSISFVCLVIGGKLLMWLPLPHKTICTCFQSLIYGYSDTVCGNILPVDVQAFLDMVSKRNSTILASMFWDVDQNSVAHVSVLTCLMT